MRRWARRGASLAPVTALLVTWELVARWELFNPALFPAPSSVWGAFVEMVARGEMTADVLASTRRGAVGYAVGCAMGILLGMLTGRWRIADQMLGQVLHVLRAFPPVAIVPFAILWFGIAETSKYFLVFWGALFPVWVNTHLGMSEVEEKYLWAARSLGARKRAEFVDVLLPAALPHILAGMRVSIGISFICVFVAEMAGAYDGIGFRISTSYLIFRVDKMMASLIVLGLLGALSDRLFSRAAARLFPWASVGRNAGGSR